MAFWLRSIIDLKVLGERQIIIDCDVIQADGGTRTASITGGCVALFLAIKNHHDDQRAINSFIAAVSLGIKNNKILLDLDYNEDSTADTDLNIVMNEDMSDIEELPDVSKDNENNKRIINLDIEEL